MLLFLQDGLQSACSPTDPSLLVICCLQPLYMVVPLRLQMQALTLSEGVPCRLLRGGAVKLCLSAPHAVQYQPANRLQLQVLHLDPLLARSTRPHPPPRPAAEGMQPRCICPSHSAAARRPCSWGPPGALLHSPVAARLPPPPQLCSVPEARLHDSSTSSSAAG